SMIASALASPRQSVPLSSSAKRASAPVKNAGGCRKSPANLQRNSSQAASLSSRLLLATRHVPPQFRTGASDERCVMGRCNLSSYYKRLSPDYYKRLSAEDRRTFDRWLQANAIFGSILAALIIAMAFAGSRSMGPRDAAVAGGTTAASEVGVP